MKLQGDFVRLCLFALGLGAWGNSASSEADAGWKGLDGGWRATEEV